MKHTDSSATPLSLISTAIPYVNAAPHLGYALEAVVTDAIARTQRARGASVHQQAGTDDNSLKNARAAAAQGIPTHALVDDNGLLLAPFLPGTAREIARRIPKSSLTPSTLVQPGPPLFPKLGKRRRAS